MDAEAKKNTVDYPWWGVAEGEQLAQGDILRGFQVVVPSGAASAEGDSIPAELKTFDLMVLSQTCDIEQGKADSILLCPWWGLWEFVDAATKKGENWGRDIRETLRRGNLPGYHLLNCASVDDLKLDCGVVDFREVYTSPTTSVRQFVRGCGKRLRLLPPYREHLAQAFARFFMRVGLPTDIPPDKIKNRPST